MNGKKERRMTPDFLFVWHGVVKRKNRKHKRGCNTKRESEYEYAIPRKDKNAYHLQY